MLFAKIAPNRKKNLGTDPVFFFAPGMGPGQFFRRLPLTMEDNYDNNTGSPVPSITKRRLVVDEVELMAMNGTSVQRPPPPASPSRSRVNRRSLRVCAGI